MGYKYTLVIFFSLLSTAVKAQWSKSDSLGLDRLLKSGKEIIINREELRNIDLGGGKLINKPLNPPSYQHTVPFDETLPFHPNTMKLTLHPLVTTHYNWDPFYPFSRVQIKGMWIPQIEKPDQEARLKSMNGIITAKMQQWLREKGTVKLPSWLGGNYMQYKPDEAQVVKLPFVEKNTGTYSHGASISCDLMLIFEKRFWDRAGEKRRARTLEVLKHYNDVAPLPMKEQK